MKQSKDTKSKRNPHTPRLVPKVDADARTQADIRQLGSMMGGMAQRIEAMSPIVQQIIVALVILNEKGIITNDEIHKKQQELMRPVEEQIAGLGTEVSGGAGDAGAGAEETGSSDTEETADADAASTDGDVDQGVPVDVEIQPEETGTVEGDGEREQPRLSVDQSEGGDKPSEDAKGNGEPAKCSDVSGAIDPSNQTADTSDD